MLARSESTTLSPFLPREMVGSSLKGLRAPGDTGESLRGIPAPAGNPHGDRTRTASLRRNAGHNPPVPSEEHDLPMDDLEECFRHDPQGPQADGSNFEGHLRLRLEPSSDRLRQAPRFGGPRHLTPPTRPWDDLSYPRRKETAPLFDN